MYIPMPFSDSPIQGPEKDPFDWKALAKALVVFIIISAPIVAIANFERTGNEQAVRTILCAICWTLAAIACVCIIAAMYLIFKKEE